MDRDLILQAAAFIDTIEQQHVKEDQAYRDGYELGYGTGLADGYKKAEDEMGAIWSKIVEDVHATARQPKRA